MSLATQTQGQVANALKRVGAPATLSAVTVGAYDPILGEAITSSVTTQTYAALDSSSRQELGMKFGQALVMDGDMKATIPAKGLAADPRPGDTLTTRGIPYKVASVRPTFLAGTPLTYEMLVRA